MLKQLLIAAVGGDLSERDSRQTHATCSIWEHRTFNMHRGVLLLQKQRSPENAASLLNEIREVVTDEFDLRWAWLRGFGYGVVVEAATFPSDAEKLADFVDTYGRNRGTLQWLIYVSEPLRLACGIHMWAEGYLTPSYRRIVRNLTNENFECPSFVRDMGAWFRFAKALHRLPNPQFKSDE